MMDSPELDGAHPRMRGEGRNFLKDKVNGSGSSPHARGGRRYHRDDLRRTGLIPACAGRAP